MQNDQNKPFPYQNLSLADMEGEIWLDFPGFETMYEISNYGRVKSLRRWIVTGKGGMVELKERILKSQLQKRLNRHVNEPVYMLETCPTKDGHQYNFSVGRVVYCTFVKKIKLKGYEPLISYHDGDGRNIHVSNLRLIDSSELQKESFKKKRNSSRLSPPKTITQFDVNGKPIKYYQSITEASNETGISLPGISGALNGRLNVIGGYFWREGRHSQKIDIDKIGQSADETLNEELKNKLNLNDVDKDNPPALLNLSLKPIAGERWKSMPGFEDLYQISNYGRVKILQRMGGQKISKWIPEKIMRLSVVESKPSQKGRKYRRLIVILKNNKKQYNITVARYVYYLFVEKFEIKDLSVSVKHIDGNPFNLHYKNLILKSAQK